MFFNHCLTIITTFDCIRLRRVASKRTFHRFIKRDDTDDPKIPLAQVHVRDENSGRIASAA